MSEKKGRALFTGSFDPVTKGHEDVIRRACALYDKLYVVVFINPEKKGFFPIEKRVELLKKVCEKFPSVTVDASNGYVADYVKEKEIDVIVRGIRGDADRAYEEEMAKYNFDRSGVSTVFLSAKDELKSFSSRLVRDTLLKDEDAKAILPEEIAEEICENWRFFCLRRE